MPLRLFFKFPANAFILSLNKVLFFTPPALYFILLLAIPLVAPVFLFSPSLKKHIHMCFDRLGGLGWRPFSSSMNGLHRASERYVLWDLSTVTHLPTVTCVWRFVDNYERHVNRKRVVRPIIYFFKSIFFYQLNFPLKVNEWLYNDYTI